MNLNIVNQGPQSSIVYHQITIPVKFLSPSRCKCWDACLKTDAGQRWYRFRQNILQYVDTPAFEWFVLVLIFASSITLCFEDIHLDKNKQLKRILYWTNFVFCLIFVIEMLLKWIALGFTKYFSSFWTILDFIIVFVRICGHRHTTARPAIQILNIALN